MREDNLAKAGNISDLNFAENLDKFFPMGSREKKDKKGYSLQHIEPNQTYSREEKSILQYIADFRRFSALLSPLWLFV